MSPNTNIQILPAFDEDGDIDLDFTEAADKIAKDRNLGITRDRELQSQGFVITDVPAKGFVTMGPKDECEPYQSNDISLDEDESLSP